MVIVKAWDWVRELSSKSYPFVMAHVHSTESPHESVGSRSLNSMSSPKWSMKQSCYQRCWQSALSLLLPTFVPNGINCMCEEFSFILQGTLVSKLYSSELSSGHSPCCYLAKMRRDFLSYWHIAKLIMGLNTLFQELEGVEKVLAQKSSHPVFFVATKNWHSQSQRK